MHFFEKQKVDQIGMMSVALQKVLIFLILVNVFSLFSAGGFFSLFLCLIGLIGAVRRRPCLLMMYFTISLVLLLVGFFLGVYLLVGFAFYFDDSDFYGSSSASSSSSFSNNFSTVPTSLAKSVMRRVFSDSSASSSSASFASSTASVSDSIGSASSSWDEYSDSTTYFITFLVSILGFFLLYMKIFSMALAFRLRKMILATPVLPTEYQVPIQEPMDNSCAVEYSDEVEMQTPGAPIAMPAPFFNQPGYMPFTPIPMPNMQQQYPGAPSMVPPPMMYGQYPVYYSFAPIPAQQPAAPAEDSKL